MNYDSEGGCVEAVAELRPTKSIDTNHGQQDDVFSFRIDSDFGGRHTLLGPSPISHSQHIEPAFVEEIYLGMRNREHLKVSTTIMISIFKSLRRIAILGH